MITSFIIIYTCKLLRFQGGLNDYNDDKHLQMGSRMKKAIFDEQTSKALKKWHMGAKKKQGLKLGKSSVRTVDGSTIGSRMHSSGPTLHRYQTTGHSTRTMPTYEDDQDDYQSDIELSPTSPTSNLIVRVDHGEQEAKENEHHHVGETNNEGGLTFVKPDPL